MILTYRCYPCILGDLASALDLVGADENIAQKVMADATAMLDRDGPKGKPPSYYITEAHRMLKRATGISEPFAQLRRRTNEIGVKLKSIIKEKIEGLSDEQRFREIVRWCVAANHLDFRTAGTGYGFDPDSILGFLQNIYDEGLAVDEVEKFHAYAQKAKRALYIHDNVGEVAIDTILIEELRSMGARITSALRGGPITSDATMDDGKAAGVFESADRVILAGPDTLGISLDEMSLQLKNALAETELVISKGQANYYVLTEYQKTRAARVVYLFSTKCDPVSEMFELKGKKNIVWLSAP